MRHGADKLARRVTRQLRVRIQRDDVLHLRQDGGFSDDERKTLRAHRRAATSSSRRACRACAHGPSRSAPARSSGEGDGKDRTSWQRGESATRRRRLASSCCLTGSRRGRIFDSARRSALRRFAAAMHPREAVSSRGVWKVGQQAEMQVCVAIGQEPDLERLDQVLDAATLVSIDGTTTSVRACAAMPVLKSIRGSACGVTSSVASQLTTVTAAWLVASRQSRMTSDRISWFTPAPLGGRAERCGADAYDQCDGTQIDQAAETRSPTRRKLAPSETSTRQRVRAREGPCRSGRSRRVPRDHRLLGRRACPRQGDRFRRPPRLR